MCVIFIPQLELRVVHCVGCSGGVTGGVKAPFVKGFARGWHLPCMGSGAMPQCFFFDVDTIIIGQT